MVLGEPCFWQELQENWCKHFRTRKHKVMTSVMSSLYASFRIHMLQSESSICGGDFPTSWIFIKNPLGTSSLFAFQIKLFSFSLRLLQIQRLAKYYQYKENPSLILNTKSEKHECLLASNVSDNASPVVGPSRIETIKLLDPTVGPKILLNWGKAYKDAYSVTTGSGPLINLTSFDLVKKLFVQNAEWFSNRPSNRWLINYISNKKGKSKL